MSKISHTAAVVLANDLRTVFGSFDTAMQDTARLVGTFLETASGADLPPASTQRALRSMSEVLTKAVEGRGDLIAAQRVMVSIKGNSNLDVVDLGCWQAFTTGVAPDEVRGALPAAA
jgi:hypothetical protein